MAAEQTGLTHITASGEAHMVDVGDKAETVRVATAEGHVMMKPETWNSILKSMVLVRDAHGWKE